LASNNPFTVGHKVRDSLQSAVNPTAVAPDKLKGSLYPTSIQFQEALIDFPLRWLESCPLRSGGTVRVRVSGAATNQLTSE
jgi:hypothetical protein